MPSRFWGEVVVTAIFILNRAPTKSLQNMTPFEPWHGKKPRVEHMKTFGCIVHVKKVGPGITKLSDRSTKMVFLGYESGTKGYRVFDPVNNRLHVSRDVVFEEKEQWDWDAPTQAGQTVSDTFIIEFQPGEENPTIDFPADSEQSGGNEQVQGGQGQVQSPQVSPAAMPGSPSTPINQDIQSAADSNGTGSNSTGSSVLVQQPVHFRTLSDLFDATEEIHDYEYSGLCLVAAEEPENVDEALEQAYWKMPWM
jgi:hypothetical protein